MVKLAHDRGELILAPERGGSVSAFRWDGVDILRPFDEAKGAEAPPTEYAAFPLFPFSGRIANSRFSFEGRDCQLPPNFPPEPHAIHGHGWQSKWDVSNQTNNSAVMNYLHEADAWPWKYEAIQEFSIGEFGLAVSLSLRNLSDTPMPAGMGWHPYFPTSGAILTSDVSEIWLSGEDMIPGAPSELNDHNDLRRPRLVSELNLDNAFSAGEKGVVIGWENKTRAKMTASEEFGHLIVYTPQGEDFFCAEPVSHSPDAINSSQPASVTGLRALQPDGEFTGTIHISVET